MVTQHRECNLDEIVNGRMILSDFGKIVENEWFKSFEIRSELILDEFIIMPNHIHAIVEIKTDEKSVDLEGKSVKTVGNPVDTHGRAYQPESKPNKPESKPNKPESKPNKPESKPNIPEEPKKIKLNQDLPIRLPKSISSFIAGFKSAVNSKIDDYIDENQLKIPKYNRNNHFFQPNYHDHVIRNHFAYCRIKKYIQKNPENWKSERNNS